MTQIEANCGLCVFSHSPRICWSSLLSPLSCVLRRAQSTYLWLVPIPTNAALPAASDRNSPLLSPLSRVFSTHVLTPPRPTLPSPLLSPSFYACHPPCPTLPTQVHYQPAPTWLSTLALDVLVFLHPQCISYCSCFLHLHPYIPRQQPPYLWVTCSLTKAP